jgi:hypothetical protein
MVKKKSWAWLIYLGILILSCLATFALIQFKPELFNWKNTLPATIAYFSLYYFIVKIISSYKKQGALPTKTYLPIARNFNDRYLDVLFGELCIFIVLLVLGVIFGTISSSIWWVCGGCDLRSILQSLKIGAILGGVAVCILFGLIS